MYPVHTHVAVPLLSLEVEAFPLGAFLDKLSVGLAKPRNRSPIVNASINGASSVLQLSIVTAKPTTFMRRDVQRAMLNSIMRAFPHGVSLIGGDRKTAAVAPVIDRLLNEGRGH